MTGIADSNYPAFEKAAFELRALGLNLISPHEVFAGETPDDSRWNEYLRHDLRSVTQCQGIILLPGWHKSKGAVIELSMALALGMDVMFYKHGALIEIT